ncbi:hypothetical protein JF66_13085 [Cryobacterium sp. MLB-32]|uniref:hypothetical protein n=1 Tax=Cryobacterium sp. MLB-32 TaxID=1529318 RepID=UPI0004E61CA2|nr:hypothetical protein [Cryobacterium sp. MLB-32]KFF59197.1 hypothetical protein JF66_13085 [Cryobacterium sp. MLB-32]
MRSLRAASQNLVGNRILAAVVLIVLGMRLELLQGLTVGYVAVVALAPVWFRVLRLYRGATTIIITGAACLVSGLWLNALAAPTHSIAAGETLGTVISLGGILCSIGFILWAREMMPVSQVALWFGVGLFAGVSSTANMFADNPWRFGYAFSVTVIILALAQLSGRRWVELSALLLVAVVSMLTGARSSFGIIFLTAILVAWQMRPERLRRGGSGWGVIVGMGALATLVYYLAQNAFLAGYFGEAARLRTVAQLDTAGSLILGGRPELGATLALMQARPQGFGAGTLLNPEELLIAKTGMSSLNYAPDNGYVERYMFGGHIELHSVVGDLWAHFGIPGLVFTAVLLVLLVWGLASAVSANHASALLIFLGVSIVWELFFGPLYTATRMLILVVGLVLVRRTGDVVSPVRPTARLGPPAREG